MKTSQLVNDSIYRKKVDASSYKNIHRFLDFIDDEKNQHIIQYMSSTNILSITTYIPDRFVFHNKLNEELDLNTKYYKNLHHCRFSKKALHYMLHHCKNKCRLFYPFHIYGKKDPIILLSEKIITYEYEKHQYKFPWSIFSYYYKFTPEFINKHKKLIDWVRFLLCHNIDEDSVHVYDIDWNEISNRTTLNNDFMYKYNKYLNWRLLSKRLSKKQHVIFSDYMKD